MGWYSVFFAAEKGIRLLMLFVSALRQIMQPQSRSTKEAVDENNALKKTQRSRLQRRLDNARSNGVLANDGFRRD